MMFTTQRSTRYAITRAHSLEQAVVVSVIFSADVLEHIQKKPGCSKGGGLESAIPQRSLALSCFYWFRPQSQPFHLIETRAWKPRIEPIRELREP